MSQNQLNKTLKAIDQNKTRLVLLRPIKPEFLVKIQDKFRIEYSYHSNHLEGNSLTLSETRALLSSELSAAKPLKDIEEMKGHDSAVKRLDFLEKLNYTEKVLKSDNLTITHNLIRELNQLILVSNYKKEVKTPEGDRAFVDVIVGQYKNKPNHVERKDGHKFYFAEPIATQGLLDDILEWFNANKDVLHPVVLASIFHYKFIRIHPFDDGNGRVARLLMNLILMHFGYPLVIISSSPDAKTQYYSALERTDANLPTVQSAVEIQEIEIFEPFIIYISQRLEYSLDLLIRGSNGEDITEVGDVLKQFKLDLKQEQTKDRVWLNKDNNMEIFINTNVIPLLEKVEKFSLILAESKFEAMKRKMVLTISDKFNKPKVKAKIITQESFNSWHHQIWDYIRINDLVLPGKPQPKEFLRSVNSIQFKYIFTCFNSVRSDYLLEINLELHLKNWSISVVFREGDSVENMLDGTQNIPGFNKTFTFAYSDTIIESQIKEIIQFLVKASKDLIDEDN